MQRRTLFGAVVLAGAGLCTTLNAAALSGTFNMSGIITATATTNSWNSDISPNAPQMFTLSSGAGSFAGENGQNVVDNLTLATEPVGSTFTPMPFIAFNVSPGLPSLMINFIYAGIGGTAGCSAAPAVGQTCTPPNPGGSPFTFTNNPPPGNIQSSAQFVFSGVTSDGLSTWTGIFTSQFNVPFQTVLAAFAPGGSGTVSNSYSATITVTPNATTPEPATFGMLGAGLLALVAAGRRKYRQV